MLDRFHSESVGVSSGRGPCFRFLDLTVLGLFFFIMRTVEGGITMPVVEHRGTRERGRPRYGKSAGY